MIRGTTPTIPIIIEGEDLTEKQIYITFKNRKDGAERTWTNGDDGFELIGLTEDNDTEVDITLTQAETLAFPKGDVRVQARWIGFAGDAWASTIEEISVNPVLLDKEIEYRE